MDLSHTPFLTPPPGVVPNFVDPVSQARSVIVINVIWITLMLCFVVMNLAPPPARNPPPLPPGNRHPQIHLPDTPTPYHLIQKTPHPTPNNGHPTSPGLAHPPRPLVSRPPRVAALPLDLTPFPSRTQPPIHNRTRTRNPHGAATGHLPPLVRRRTCLPRPKFLPSRVRGRHGGLVSDAPRAAGASSGRDGSAGKGEGPERGGG